MSKFYSLFSSSKGNAAFVGGPSGGILVDAGVSCRRLTRSLAAHDIPAEAVQAICITHAHSDHIAGLRVFLKSHPVPVYATEETLQELSGAMALPDVPLRAVTPQKAGIIAGVEYSRSPPCTMPPEAAAIALHCRTDRAVPCAPIWAV